MGSYTGYIAVAVVISSNIPTFVNQSEQVSYLLQSSVKNMHFFHSYHHIS